MYIKSQDLEKFKAIIQEYSKIIIHRHKRPDPDAIGSQLGLRYLLQANFPDKEVLAAGSLSSGLKWLGEMDKVSKEDYQNALVIICDTANTDRIDGESYTLANKVIKIDHHPIVEDFGDLQLIYPQASSTSEIIGLLARELGSFLTMNAKVAKLLYAGIVGDTGRFMFKSTTSLTFAITSWLMEQPFSTFEINDKFQSLTLNQAKFQAYVFEQLQMNQDGVAWLTISKETRESYQITEEETNSFVNLPSLIEGNYCWVLFVEQEGDTPYWRCRIRSKGPIINEIASRHGGGGHPMASGANAYSEQEMQEIIGEMSEASRKYKANLKTIKKTD